MHESERAVTCRWTAVDARRAGKGRGGQRMAPPPPSHLGQHVAHNLSVIVLRHVQQLGP